MIRRAKRKRKKESRRQRHRARLRCVNLVRNGVSSARKVALRLGISPRTLEHWVRELPSRAVGRPQKRVAWKRRKRVVRFLLENGFHLGLPTLQAEFPKIPRAVLHETLQAWREIAARRKRRHFLRLVWERPGGVWAADFTKPPQPIEGTFPSVLLVRDLASSCVLAAAPVAAEDAAHAQAVFQELFHNLGPPLVIKLDNGSAFIERGFRRWLAGLGVQILFSPPHTPSYNGSIESGNSSIKAHARHEATKHGRELWTAADLEVARQRCNRLRRPWGAKGPTPEQVWLARTPLCPLERQGFLAIYRFQEQNERVRRNVAITEDVGRLAQASIDRHALPRSMKECGILDYRRGRITPVFFEE